MRLLFRHSKEMTYLAAASDRSPSLYDKKLVQSRLFHQGADLILLISYGIFGLPSRRMSHVRLHALVPII